MRDIEIVLAGLGIILYSPPAVAHIKLGSDYLQEHFWKPEDVARHVMDCQLTAFCTGTPGTFLLRFHDGPPTAADEATAEFCIRLGLEVHSNTVCIGDLYELLGWENNCPKELQLEFEDGWYRLTVCTTSPKSGILGDNQLVEIWMEPVSSKPALRWDGVPSLC